MARLTSDENAAKVFDCSVRTIQRKRVEFAVDEEVQTLISDNIKKVNEGWVERTANARNQILSRLIELAVASDRLRDVCGALKIVHDANVSERILDGGLDTERTIGPKPSSAVTEIEKAAARLLQ